ncbi:hypothetical protein [Sphingobium xenophagum]
MVQDPHAADATVYNNLVARAHLRTIRLTASKFELKPEALGLDPDGWRNGISAALAHSFYEPESGSLYGIFSFDVICRQGRKRVLSINASYLTNYRVEGDCDGDACELFLERVGKIATYPYFRTHVATLTSQAGLLMQPLPIMGVAPRSIEGAGVMDDIRSRRPALPKS